MRKVFIGLLIFKLSLVIFTADTVLAEGSNKCASFFSQKNNSISSARDIKRESFEQAKIKIKSKFSGQDSVIDSVFSQIETWYLYPHTRIAPTIVNLFGMTGTGKTSLVRSIIEELRLEREFSYFDMETYSSTDGQINRGFAENLAAQFSIEKTHGKFELNTITKPKNPVLMMDEFQKIYTLEDGKYIRRPQAQAIWELLGNDGKLNIKNPAFEELRDMLRNPDLYLPIPKKVKYGSNDAQLKKVTQELLLLAETLFEKTPPHTELDMSNSLIFIGANLDGVFSGSRSVNQESITPNSLHKTTKNISHSDIRKGLSDIFRPEHVSRLGSRYVVFPTLSEAAFREFIDGRLQMIKGSIFSNYKIVVNFTENFRNRIYQEGVIPSQGIRPLIQTVNAFAQDPISRVFSVKIKQDWYTNRRKMKVSVDVNSQSKYSSWTVVNGPLKGRQFDFVIPSEYVNSLKLRPEPYRSMVALRLSAEAIVGTQHYGQTPNYIKANSTVKGSDGTVVFTNPVTSKNAELLSSHINKISVLLSSYVAEKMIFGEATEAAQSKIFEATIIAKNLVGESGLSLGDKPLVASENRLPRGSLLNYEVESILNQAQDIARSVLLREKVLLATLTESLRRNVELDSKMILSIIERNWTDKEFIEQVIHVEAPRSSQEQDTIQSFIDSPETFKLEHSQERRIGF